MSTARKILNLGELIATRGAAPALLVEALELQKRWGDFKYLANVDDRLLLAQATKFGCDVDTFADWAEGEYGGIRKIYADRFIDFAQAKANKLKATYLKMPAIPELDQVGITAELAQKIKTARLLRECHITMLEQLEDAAAAYSNGEFVAAVDCAVAALCVHKVSLQIEAGHFQDLKLSKSVLLENMKQVELLRAELLAAIFNQARSASLGLTKGSSPAA